METEKERSSKKVMVVIVESDCSYKALIWVLENLKESLKQSPLFIFATQPLINSNFAVSPSLGFIRLTCTLSYTAVLTNQAQERNKEVSMGLLDKAKSIFANGGASTIVFTSKEALDEQQMATHQIDPTSRCSCHKQNRQKSGQEELAHKINKYKEWKFN
ncbi:hypothetical protein L484_015433 [Morus notabilis]|uniref:UspA domain-containing protein n=1 Tax=Morus notabilis TaxID=981085 RepID=W9R9K1_9ROSA|nr:hypothetical protein L484_015433 [Morus notabilis]